MKPKTRRGKHYTRSEKTERQGISLCSTIVHDMGHIWHERHVDHGIDGVIELVEDNLATNRVLWVQSKARGETNPFTRETDTSFEFSCDPDDIDYWTSGTAPVLLVCSHPHTKEAWFKAVGPWFDDPARRRDRKIIFDKVADRFDENTGRALLEHGGADQRLGLYLTPVPRHETLTTNLLHVDTAPVLSVFESKCRKYQDANLRLAQAGLRTVNDLGFTDKTILTFRTPDDPVVRALADGAVEQIDIETLAADEATRRILVWTMNGTLRELHPELRFHKDRKFLYFRPNSKGIERRIRNTGKGQGRAVVSRHEPAEGATWLGYVRHYAADLRFELLEDEWFLAINPTYHFTSDGYDDFPFADTQLAGIKRIEGHEAVLGQIKFWAGHLQGRQDLFNTTPDPRLRFGQLVTADVTRGIDDAKWKPRSEEIQRALEDQLTFDDVDVQLGLGLDDGGDI